MAETTMTPTTASLGDVAVRPLQESDLPEADRILRAAFNTFLGIPDLFGDKDYVRTRWRADPRAALAAERDGRLIGSNFITGWGSVGFFGPLSVRPELWDQGVASRLMPATLDMLDTLGTRHAGLFTFPHSAKHLGLYQKYGFSPGFLTPVMVRPVQPSGTAASYDRYRQLPEGERAGALDACRALTDAVYEGLDVSREIRAVEEQQLGDVVLVHDTSGLAAMAVCHLGPGSEAGSGGCYVKFGAARPGAGAAERFDALLGACEELAAEHRSTHVELGVNTARHEAYAAVTARGYRAVMIGVTMHRNDDDGCSRRGAWVIDDWR
jgi:predicted N-acetyltransferase YhbS